MFENEKVVEVKTCPHCSASFEITDKDLEFYEKVSPKFGDKKYSIPTPKLCPDCRQQRRLSFRNERKLYKRKCNATGKDIISIYSPDKPYKVYEQSYWWSDKWDPLDYGRDFDFTKSFFEQFEKLMKEVPIVSLYATNSENSEYTNYAANNKNCYLTSSFVWDCQDCLYWNFLVDCKNIIDCSHVQHSQHCYECTDCISCINTFFSNNTFHTQSSYFLSNCIWCSYCFWCVNLLNKKFHIFNKSYSEKEYFQTLETLLKNSISYNNELFLKFKENIANKYINSNESENVLWDYIFQWKNIINSFDIYDWENIKHSVSWSWAKNCLDCTWFWYDWTSFLYESANTTWSKSIFTCISWFVNDLIYSMNCFNSSNLFWCIGLKNNASYCILNKQYTKSEYEILVPKIIEHMQKTWEWGEFFPSSISPFGYNETIAMEYFPINLPSKPSSPTLLPKREGGLEIPLPLGEVRWGQGIFNRSDYEPPFPKVDKLIPANKLPENITQIPDDILNWAIECEVTKKPFRIISQELEFYKKHNLPIPKRHPDQRHLDRMALRNPRKLFDRKCDKCGSVIKTTYSPERKEIVYCEECYEKEIY